MKNAARLTLALAAVLLAVAPFALAADAPKPVGTWDAGGLDPERRDALGHHHQAGRGALKAEIEIDGTSRTVTDEKLEGNVFRMKVQYDGGVYDVEVKIDGDTLEGTWQGGGYSGTLKAKRRP